MFYKIYIFLGPHVQKFHVLAEWCWPNLPLAILYELACQVHSNYKLKYLTRFRSSWLLNIYYWEAVPECANSLLSEPFVTVLSMTEGSQEALS